jgi:hypothetical protein
MTEVIWFERRESISINLFLVFQIVLQQSPLLGAESQKLKAILISPPVANHGAHFPRNPGSREYKAEADDFSGTQFLRQQDADPGLRQITAVALDPSVLISDKITYADTEVSAVSRMPPPSPVGLAGSRF